MLDMTLDMAGTLVAEVTELSGTLQASRYEQCWQVDSNRGKPLSSAPSNMSACCGGVRESCQAEPLTAFTREQGPPQPVSNTHHMCPHHQLLSQP